MADHYGSKGFEVMIDLRGLGYSGPARGSATYRCINNVDRSQS